MMFSESEIEDILRYYDVGSLVKFEGKLDNGFQSENFHISFEISFEIGMER
jgi:hypothetical protein